MKSLSVLVTLLILLTIFSCSKEIEVIENNVLTEENFEQYITDVRVEFDQNEKFVDDFLSLARRNEMTQEALFKMLDILGISDNLNVERLDEINQANNVYDELRQGLTETSKIETRAVAVDCDKLVEIRNVMLEECAQYIVVIEQACSGAVMIAYWLNEEDCTTGNGSW